jgi:uncharacterized protein YecE (DUF72 family)
VYQQMLQARQRKPNLPIPTQREVGFPFLRYIGHPVMEQNAQFIAEWADHLAKSLERGPDAGRDAYVFCHCPDARLDPWLCREFHRQVQARFPIPPLPWDEIDAPIPGQTSFL